MIGLPHEVHDSISSCPHVCAALTQRPDESAVLGASMRRWQSETLSLIAGCMEQRGKYELISFLLDKMCFATCPPPGVSFTTSLLPVAHTLIYNYELWDDKDEWTRVFDKVAEHADLEQPWGEAQETPNNMYFQKFECAY